MRMMRSRLSALFILKDPGAYSSKVEPVEKKRLAASSVAEVMYRVATTEEPSETQKLCVARTRQGELNVSHPVRKKTRSQVRRRVEDLLEEGRIARFDFVGVLGQELHRVEHGLPQRRVRDRRLERVRQPAQLLEEARKRPLAVGVALRDGKVLVREVGLESAFDAREIGDAATGRVPTIWDQLVVPGGVYDGTVPTTHLCIQIRLP